MTKRRRGTQNRRPARPGWERTQPVKPDTVTTRIPGLPWLAGGAIVLAVLAVAFILLRPGSGSGGGASPSPSASAPSPSASAARGTDCPTSQPAALQPGQTRTVTMTTPKGTIVIQVKADLSPIAAGNFVALAACGYYDGSVFHRTATLADGTPFVIQGGDGPDLGYTIKDEPVTEPYKRGTVAMARTSAPNSVTTQFFIVLDDKDDAILGDANTYQIIGNVTSGMETADAIYVASGGVELPSNPVPITTATVANP